MSEEKNLPHNIILGKQESDDTVRPDWVPANAEWACGLWYLNGRQIFDPATYAPITAATHREVQMEANRVQKAKMHEGLPPGYYRHGGVIYNPRGDKALNDPLLPNGYIDDGSHLPGYAEYRAARIARIQEADAAEKVAIAEMEAATQRRHEAAARRSQVTDVLVGV